MLDKVPPNVLSKIASGLTRRDVARLTAVSKAIRPTAKQSLVTRSRHRGVFRSAIKLKTLMTRPTSQRQLLASLTRLMARVPKTYRHPNGSTYRPRQRMHAFLFRNGHPRTMERNIFQGYKLGQPNGTHFFTYNPHAGAHFRNGQWNVVIPVRHGYVIAKRS